MKPRPEVVFQEIEGEMVLLDPDADSYYALDPVGTRAWELLHEHEDLDGVVAAMLDEFEVDEATLRADLDVLLGELRAAGLVSESGASP
jgi:Coenzyme PQQ synthesis protein D (PqqD)